jgi:tRNA (guanine-N7-)-methyltransferase
LGRVRVREHVNPLCRKYQVSASAPDWTKISADSSLPLHLDIGCARGRFLWHMAQVQTDWNFLGLEIREPLVEEANLWRDEKGLTNLHYLFCNANSSLKPILETLPAGTLQRVSIQFPDPWFKKKHHKRRVVQQELVGELATYLAVGGEVFIQSDIEEVESEMCDRFSSDPSFKRTNNGEWLAENPLPVATEREIATLKRGEPVYRAVFHK